MNRIENIILALATAAAFLIASTAHANPDPCPETGNNSRPAVESGEGLNDGLIGTPRVKTPNGTRLARDLELEEANRDSGMNPEDGLPGRPVVKTPTGTRTARDLENERPNSGDPCPEDKNNNDRDADRSRTNSANQAGSLLKHHTPVLPDFNGTRTKDGELADRDQMIDSLKDAAKRNNNQDGDKENDSKNTTLDKALRRAGIDPSRLNGSKTKTDKYGTTITLPDGTEVHTGPDSDPYGTSVTTPDGSMITVTPDGRVSTRQGSDGDTVTQHPNGTTTVYDPKQRSMTTVDNHGRTLTRPLDFYMPWFDKGWAAKDLLDLLNPLPGQKDKGNTTLRDALRRAGVSADDLRNATGIETSKHSNSVKITLKDGTVIWTGPDSDELGTSVTKPNGDETTVHPDGRVSTRQGRDGHVVTTHPDGTTTDYDPEDDTMTVRDGKGHSETRTMEFWIKWFEDGHKAGDLLRLYYPE
jgi:phage baseplate assembly protein gpV